MLHDEEIIPLMKNTTLRNLYLSFNQLRNQEDDFILSKLITNMNLITLDLSHNFIRDEGVTSLLKAATNKDLRMLNIFGNKIDKYLDHYTATTIIESSKRENYFGLAISKIIKKLFWQFE